MEKIKKKPAKEAYLTFDDGPSGNTVKILDILSFYKVKATFFVIGHEGTFEKNLYRQIIAAGHSIGVHSYTHDYSKIYSSVHAFKEDLNLLELLLVSTIKYKPDILRFPGGSNNRISHQYGGPDLMPCLIKEVLSEGYQYFDWNVNSQDASAYVPAYDVITNSVLTGAKHKEKAIILLHDAPAKTTTVKALPEIINELKKQRFHFHALTKDSFPYRFAFHRENFSTNTKT